MMEVGKCILTEEYGLRVRVGKKDCKGGQG